MLICTYFMFYIQLKELKLERMQLPLGIQLLKAFQDTGILERIRPSKLLFFPPTSVERLSKKIFFPNTVTWTPTRI